MREQPHLLQLALRSSHHLLHPTAHSMYSEYISGYAIDTHHIFIISNVFTSIITTFCNNFSNLEVDKSLCTESTEAIIAFVDSLLFFLFFNAYGCNVLLQKNKMSDCNIVAWWLHCLPPPLLLLVPHTILVLVLHTIPVLVPHSFLHQGFLPLFAQWFYILKYKCS